MKSRSVWIWCWIIGAVLADAAGAANRVVLARPNSTDGAVRFIVGDTEAGLPMTFGEGVSAWAKDTDRLVCFFAGAWGPCNDGAGGGLSSSDIDTSAELRAILTDEIGTGALLFGLAPTMEDGLACSGDQVVKRDAGDTAFECATFTGADPTLAGDVDGLGSANDLDEAAVEVELENVIDLQDLQGAATDGQIPNGITIDLATQATTALAGDSAAGFFPSGTLEDARVDGSLEADEVNPTLGSQTQGDYIAGVTASQGLAMTGSEGGTLGLQDCAADEVLARNSGDTAWICAAVSGGSGLSQAQVLARTAVLGAF